MNDYSPKAFEATKTPRIFCIGRNYAKHIAELNHGDAQECVIFMKPASALVASNTEISVPTNLGPVHHEAELVVEIGHGGRTISAQNARAHIAGIGLGLDLTLRGVQNELKATGEPWEKAKAFDYGAPLAPLRPLDEAMDLAALTFQLEVNGECRQQGHTHMMLVDICGLIERVSAHWQLLPGDLIYTGTPEGVGEIHPGDTLALSGTGLADGRWNVVAAIA